MKTFLSTGFWVLLCSSILIPSEPLATMTVLYLLFIVGLILFMMSMSSYPPDETRAEIEKLRDEIRRSQMFK